MGDAQHRESRAGRYREGGKRAGEGETNTNAKVGRDRDGTVCQGSRERQKGKG